MGTLRPYECLAYGLRAHVGSKSVRPDLLLPCLGFEVWAGPLCWDGRIGMCDPGGVCSISPHLEDMSEVRLMDLKYGSFSQDGKSI